jgi:hypothetical protein
MKRTHLVGRSHSITRVLWAVVPIVLCSFSIAQTDTVRSYEFLPNQSRVIRTGGIAGIHEEYQFAGGFSLRLDGSGGASFDSVGALLGPPALNEDLGTLFHMTELTGTVIDATHIEFTGETQPVVWPGMITTINLTIQGDLVMLTGGFDQNDIVNDGFRNELDAVAQIPEPGTMIIMTLGGMAILKRRKLLPA